VPSAASIFLPTEQGLDYKAIRTVSGRGLAGPQHEFIDAYIIESTNIQR